MGLSKKNYEEFIKKKTINLILKTHQRFKSESENVFTKEINKIALSWKDDKIQSIDATETYGCETSKSLISKKTRSYM